MKIENPKSIKPSILLQREATYWYFVTLYNISSIFCVPIGSFVPKFARISLFGKKEKSGKLGNFCKCFFETDRYVKSKYTFSSNLVQKYSIFRKLCHFQFSPIYKDMKQDLKKTQWVPLKNAVTFKVKKLELSNLAILSII